MNTKPPINRLAICVLCTSTMLYIPSGYAATPTLQLFPNTVISSMKNSQASAEQMDQTLEPLAMQLQNQMDLYNDAQCDSNALDSGCLTIKQGISSAFTGLLQAIKGELPNMKKSLQSIDKNLGKSIKTKLGYSKTLLDLDAIVQGKESSSQEVSRASRKGKKGMAQMFRSYNKMLEIGGKQESFALVAADIYAETYDALQALNTLEMNIDYSIARNQIDKAWGSEPSAEMIATVTAVKGLLYGYEEGEMEIPMIEEDLDPAHDMTGYTYH